MRKFPFSKYNCYNWDKINKDANTHDADYLQQRYSDAVDIFDEKASSTFSKDKLKHQLKFVPKKRTTPVGSRSDSCILPVMVMSEPARKGTCKNVESDT